MHMCLWGNATVGIKSSLRSIIVDTLMNVDFQDLSLLTNVTHADIQKLQTVSKSEQMDRARYILKDDGPLAWDLLNRVRQDKSGVSRVDFILDNGEWPIFSNASIHIELLCSRIRGWLHSLLERLKAEPPPALHGPHLWRVSHHHPWD